MGPWRWAHIHSVFARFAQCGPVAERMELCLAAAQSRDVPRVAFPVLTISPTQRGLDPGIGQLVTKSLSASSVVLCACAGSNANAAGNPSDTFVSRLCIGISLILISMKNHTFNMKTGVDVKHLAGNRRGVVARQQKRGSADLAGIDCSSQRRLARSLIQDFIKVFDT